MTPQTFSKGFSKTLEYSSIPLSSAEDIVRFSFIVQKSICFLDLSPCRKAWFPRDLMTSFGWKYFGLGNLRDVNSEEKCQKMFSTLRYLLYTLHLDLPRGREHSLKEDVPESVRFRYYYDGPHVGKIFPLPGFHARLLSDFVPYAIESNMPKLRIFKWLVKFASSEEPFSGEPLTQNVDKFFDCFYPEITDEADEMMNEADEIPEFRDFIMHASIVDWIAKDVNPEVVESMLRHARQFGRRDLDEAVESVEIFRGEDLIPENCFLNIGPVLKFISFKRFTSEEYRRYFHSIALVIPGLNYLLDIEEILMKRGRIKHMLQILWMYIFGPNACIEALRLLWSSFPDACISFEELRTAFGRVFTERGLEIIYEFYATAVEVQHHEYANPRSLRHLCKCALRSVFQENGIWIPHGVEQIGLPGNLRSFLNLEKEHLPDAELNA